MASGAGASMPDDEDEVQILAVLLPCEDGEAEPPADGCCPHGATEPGATEAEGVAPQLAQEDAAEEEQAAEQSAARDEAAERHAAALQAARGEAAERHAAALQAQDSYNTAERAAMAVEVQTPRAAAAATPAPSEVRGSHHTAESGAMAVEVLQPEAAAAATLPSSEAEPLAEEPAASAQPAASAAEAPPAGAAAAPPPSDARPPKRPRLTEQGQCLLAVKGSRCSKLNGTWAEVAAPRPEGLPAFRKLGDGGGWSELVLYRSRGRWKFRDSLELGASKAFAQSAKGAAAKAPPSVESWVACCNGEWPEDPLKLEAVQYKDLTAAARREAKAAWKERYELTLWRSTANGCPTNCGVPWACHWGMRSEAALLCHLNYYHRGSEPYYKLHRKLWREEVAIAEADVQSPPEELLAEFQTSMRAHGYDEAKLQRHVRNIRHDVGKLGLPLSKALAYDPGVIPTIEEWPEDVSGKGHYSVSFRWFQKWAENSAVEAMARLSDIAEALEEPSGQPSVLETTPPPPPPKRLRRLRPEPEVATPARAWRDEAASPPAAPKAEPASSSTSRPKAEPASSASPRPDRAAERRLRGAMERAGDPFLAVAELLGLQGQLPKVRAAPARGGGRRGGGCARGGPAAPAEAEGAGAELAADLASVAAGDRHEAESAALREESGPAAAFLASGGEGELGEEAAGRAWLWAFAGLGRAAARAKVLAALALRAAREPTSAGMGTLLARLLCAAHSPHASPGDVLHAAAAWLLGEVRLPPEEKLSFAPLAPLAKRAFDLPSGRWPGKLRDLEEPFLLKLAAFGALLADVLAADAAFDSRKSPDLLALREKLQGGGCSRSTWCAVGAFLSGLLWRLDATMARESLASVRLADGIPQLFVNNFALLQAYPAHAVGSQARPAAPKAVSAPAAGPWHCPACTFVNDGGERCKMCITRRPILASQPAAPPAAATQPATQAAATQAAATRTAATQPSASQPAATRAAATQAAATQAAATQAPAAPPPAVASPSRSMQSAAAPPPSPPAASAGGPAAEAASRQPPAAPAAPPAAAAPAAPAPAPAPAAAPAPEAAPPAQVRREAAPAGLRVVSARDVDVGAALPAAVEGLVVSRLEYKKGAPPLGFQIRLQDASGKIDVKFFQEAAEAFRREPALQRGARVRLEGFHTWAADARYAPPGRKLELRFSAASLRGAAVRGLEAAAPQRPLSVAEVLAKGGLVGAEVDLEALVLVAGEVEKKALARGGEADLRTLWLADGLGPEQKRLRWSLWDDKARQQLPSRKKLRICGAMLKQFGSERQLTGAKRIEVVQ